MLQFRVNEQILSDPILKAYQKEIELRAASKEANKDTKGEEDDRRIHGLETYNMEANPRYNELFAGDSVFLTTNRKSARRLSDYRDKRKTYLCCLKGKNPHEDGKPMQFAQPVEDAAADFDVEAGSQHRS